MCPTRSDQSAVNAETGNALTDVDYANLARRWIDKQLADAARIRRVDSGAGRLLISVGRITHSAPALDISLELWPTP